jgi:ribose transport system ATP-binding protein
VPGNYGPKVAEDLGIVTIYQHFHLIPHLTVAENLALKSFVSEPGWYVNWRTVQRRAQEALARLHFPIDPAARVKDLSVAQQQMLEIAIALSKKAQVIVMDEPTAALSQRETEVLFSFETNTFVYRLTSPCVSTRSWASPAWWVLGRRNLRG